MQSIQETAQEFGNNEQEVHRLLAESRKKLHNERGKRPRPHLDDKIVAIWNGMAISAFAMAGRIFRGENKGLEECFPVDGVDPDVYISVAEKVADFIYSRLWNNDTNKLQRSFCKGPSAVNGFADDYAFVIGGLLDLYEATGAVKWLQWAMQMQSKMDELFWDNKTGGYFSTSGDDPSILLKVKEDYDGAEPAASSVAAANLLRLAGLLGNEDYKSAAVKTINAFQNRLENVPFAIPQMCASGFLLQRWPLRQVVVVGSLKNPETQHLLDAVHSPFVPDKSVIIIDPTDSDCLEFWKSNNQEAVTVASSLLTEGGDCKPTVFVCQNYTCQAPTSDSKMVKELLTNVQSGSRIQQVDLATLGIGSSS